MLISSIILVLFSTVNPVHGVTEYFSWSHASQYDPNIKRYVLDHFDTDYKAAFGWKFSTDRDSLKLASDPDGPGYVLEVFYKAANEIQYQFLGFKEAKNTTDEALDELFLISLENIGMCVEKMGDQGYDGAANMPGTRASYDSDGKRCTRRMPCQRGAQFYIMPPQLFNQAKSFAALEYQVYFKPGFEFASGGKLPGLFGGRRSSCKGCSGEADGCFSARLMWRAGGHYEVYAYIPYSVQDGGWSNWCDKYGDQNIVICPLGNCGTRIGLSFTDDQKFIPGRWHSIREEIDLGEPNRQGRISLWVDEKLVIRMTDIVLRTSSSVNVEGVLFSTFYGGSDEYFGNHGDTSAYFRNFRVTDEMFLN